MTSRGNVAGIILAGGMSTRLGRDKASQLLLGRSLLQRVIDRLDGLVDEYVIVTATGQQLPPTFASRPITPVEDLFPGVGPLGGLYTGLSSISAPRAIAVACDMPLLKPALLRLLLRLQPEHDAAVPTNGLPEPLCAVYATSCLPAIKARLEAAQYKMTGFFEAVDVRFVEPSEWQRPDPEGVSFLNVNDEDDLRRAESLLG
ncbi:MAG TPA: molybdenum cofactor guanylyltransferase [Dehalococcoidia bacterium]|nr:molybdenum cofactor guanylyltransferase [Dehalococcoidia bacterium]